MAYDPLMNKQVPDSLVTISVEEYKMLLVSQNRLDDVRLIIANDEKKYGHLDSVAESTVEALLGLERKEKAD